MTVARQAGDDAPLTIPDVSGLALRDAAMAYARAGLHIVPTLAGDVKNPGSVVGAGWPKKSSVDPAQIKTWWRENDDIGGIAFHPGPSGAVVFDYDKAHVFMPDEVREALETGIFQQSRKNGERGHYLFACSPGEFGGSAGDFARWGEVRSQGGVIILAPSEHPEDDGLYLWHGSGELPPLPDVLRDMLAAPGETAEPKTPEELKKFLAKYTESNEPQGVQGFRTTFNREVEGGASRHDTMRDVLPWAFEEAIIGRFSAEYVHRALKFAFHTAKPEARSTGEFDRLVRWAAAKAELTDPEEIRRKVSRGLYADPLDPIRAEVTEFWESSAQLRDLRQFARARLVGPAAMLGTTLARVTAHIPPNVVLPPIVGGHASLNLFVALVGRSGESKSASMRASFDWLDIEPDYPPSKPGSGEGLAKCFAYTSKAGNVTRQIGKQWSVLAQLPEVDALSATVNRGGATILSTLREGWSGERIGFDYAGADKRIVLRDNRYRLCLVMGVQPERAGWLMADADGGTPQRFVWFPASDPDAPDTEPPEPPRLPLGRWREPGPGAVMDADAVRVNLLDTPADPSEYVVIGTPAVAVERIKATQRAIRRGATDVDPLDGHTLLCRLKVAAALMALEDRQDEITEADWERAGVVMKVSDLTRTDVRRKIQERTEGAERSRGRSEAQREIARNHVLSEEAKLVAAMAERIVERLKTKDGQVLSTLRKAMSKANTRERFETAVSYAEENKLIRRENFTTPDGRKSARLCLA